MSIVDGGWSILVFARAPVPGQTKRRLVPAIGPERAARLHAAILQHTVETAIAAEIGDVALWCTPQCAAPLFLSLERTFDVALKRQQGADLGQRLHHAIASALVNKRAVVVVGSDCPFLTVDDFRSCVDRLESVDAVIGPAADGGYYLLALKRVDPHLFDRVSWGEASVAATTRSRLLDLGWSWCELGVKHDIDRPDDLVLLDSRWLG